MTSGADIERRKTYSSSRTAQQYHVGGKRRPYSSSINNVHVLSSTESKVLIMLVLLYCITSTHQLPLIWQHVLVCTCAQLAGALAASTTEECASLVPIEDRRRGKGAFFSGCTSRSASTGRGGCWSALIEEQNGCQTCIVQVRVKIVTMASGATVLWICTTRADRGRRCSIHDCMFMYCTSRNV